MSLVSSSNIPAVQVQTASSSPQGAYVLKREHATYSQVLELLQGVYGVLDRYPGTRADAVYGVVLTETQQFGRLLFILLNPDKMGKVAPYQSPDILKLISAKIKFPTFWGNHSGFRYIVHLAPRRGINLPKAITFDGWQAGRVKLGVSKTGYALASSWHDFGHAIIAGITQFGKSNTLRVVFTQAVHEGHLLYLGNYASNTWNPLVDVQHPQIKMLVNTSEEYLEIIYALIEERDRRQEMFINCPGHPDNLEEYNHLSSQPLPRIVAFLDEFSAAVEAEGGAKSELSMKTVELLKTALKYGIQLVLAGQDFYVNDIGHLVNHCSTRICLRVNSPYLSRALVGETGAEKLKTPGRALTNKWKVSQIALISKDEMLKSLSSPSSSGLDVNEEKLAKALWSYTEQPGWMDIERIRQATGLSQDKARALRLDFVTRGLAKHFPDRNNAIFLTVKA